MKTFLRKLKLSFLAMLCGWIACNIAMWIAYGVVMLFRGEPLFEAYRLDVTLIFLALTGLSITGAWIIIFLPVDLIVRDTSKLRRPKTAALTGLASAFLYVGGLMLIANSQVPLDEAAWSVYSAFAFGAAITGTVAAYVRARMDQPKSRTVS
ncbi:hypothetical protein [Prosthecobacter sp.]|uniref:hypothetical protein n=1 Tax=Prosthecobacter sp. TaxID=1965333 RepID=UPI002ABA65DE|nr:hypothetical protein [Prosthecobacter sp.]MDZ4402236.1 hypothetical protein [Prosthecobacter sp.]